MHHESSSNGINGINGVTLGVIIMTSGRGMLVSSMMADVFPSIGCYIVCVCVCVCVC